ESSRIAQESFGQHNDGSRRTCIWSGSFPCSCGSSQLVGSGNGCQLCLLGIGPRRRCAALAGILLMGAGAFHLAPSFLGSATGATGPSVLRLDRWIVVTKSLYHSQAPNRADRWASPRHGSLSNF